MVWLKMTHGDGASISGGICCNGSDGGASVEMVVSTVMLRDACGAAGNGMCNDDGQEGLLQLWWW